MNKTRYALALCGLLAIASCSKSSSKSGAADTFDYSIKAIDDVSLKMNANISVPIQVKRLAGTTESVSLAVSGLPANVTAAFNAIAGEPDFATQLNILVQGNAAVGTYPIRVVGVSKSGLTHEQPFTLVVKNENCALDMIGNWQGISTCQTTNFTSAVTSDPLYPYRVSISNFGNTGLKVDATLDCATGVITLSPKSGASIAIDEGTGTFTDNKISIDYKASAPGQHMNCSATYTR